MTPGKHHATPHDEGGESHGSAVRLLELLDNWAHIVVAAFFILMASTVIIHMSVIFLRQIPLIVPAATTTEQAAVAQESTPSAPLKEGSIAEKPPVSAKTPMSENSYGMSREKTEETHAQSPADPFVKNSLELLSNILFVVILLELLRTIITYLQTHDIQAIMQEFLVVGIISSVRKILLVGAEASLIGSKGMEFIQEASGVVIDIIGILLLILGLVMLKRAFGSKVVKEAQEY